MRIIVQKADGDEVEGVLALKDESFIMLKIGENKLDLIHWDEVEDIKRISKGGAVSINMETFRKIRE